MKLKHARRVGTEKYQRRAAEPPAKLALAGSLRHPGTMQQRCEVCENFRPEGDLKPGRVLEAVAYGERTVLLCRAHAGIAASSGVTTFEELRELYTESSGLRSYVPRRARLAPAKSRAKKGKTRSLGRRASDVSA
jgi:hypothetical protein